MTASGASGLAYPAKFLSTRAVWFHPTDAERLALAEDDEIKAEGLEPPGGPEPEHGSPHGSGRG